MCLEKEIEKARIEYETTNIPLRKIAKKHDISESYILKLSAKEKWTKFKGKTEADIEAKIEAVKKTIIDQKTDKIEELADKIILNQQKVLDDIAKIKDVCMQPGRYYNPAAALKACELEGKHLKMWVERVENEHDFKNLNVLKLDMNDYE